MSQQINLYEARLRPRHELLTGRNLGVAALLLLLLVTGVSLWARDQAERKTRAADALQVQVTGTQNQLIELETAATQRQTDPALVAEIAIAKKLLGARQEVLTLLDSGALGNSVGFSPVMIGFARQTQADLWLTGFMLSAGGDNVEIHGRLLDPARLPSYVQHLSREPVFQGRRFAALEMNIGTAEKRPDLGGAAAVAGIVELGGSGSPDAAAASAGAAKLPHFVEFVLRTAKADDALSALGQTP